MTTTSKKFPLAVRILPGVRPYAGRRFAGRLVTYANGIQAWEVAVGGLSLSGDAADIRTYRIYEVEEVSDYPPVPFGALRKKIVETRKSLKRQHLPERRPPRTPRI